MYRITSFLFILSILAAQLTAQNWTTHCGSNERNGLSKQPGPQSVSTPIWTVTNATPTALGMNIYSFGDRFVTSRVDFSPYNAIIECRDLTDGTLIWTSPDLGPESILYAMGFNEDAVYAHDYHSSLFYALNPGDGSVKWMYIGNSYTFAPMDGVIYTCERNVIINGALGSVDASTRCLDKETGELLWTNSNWFAVTPNETKAAHGDHLYLITGAINQPKQLAAVDIRTGESLYYSEELPGDADQEGPITISPEGTIFFRRDGGDLFAVEDDGSGFNILWTYTPVNMGLFVVNHCIDHDGNLLIFENDRIYRLDRASGSVLDSSSVNVGNAGRITIGSDSVIYVNNSDGAYYALSYDLQTPIWSLNLSGNYYAGPALSRNGVMVVCGAGNTIKAYQFEGQHAPVADFTASSYKTATFDFIDFTDQSSFQPTSWFWEFPGGNPASSIDQHPTYITYETPGVYDVTMIATNDLGSDTLIKHCLIEVVEAIYVSEKNDVDGLSVYPNPSGNIVVIESDIVTRILVTDPLGKAIYNDESIVKQRMLDVSSYSPGIYQIIFYGPEDEVVGFRKVIVQR